MDKGVQTEGFDDKIDEWLEWDKNPQSRQEIKLLRDLHAYPTLKKLLATRLKFGISGLRAPMGAGSTQMNDLVVIQTTQGLVAYLESISPEEVKQRGVAIGYDARHNSKRFAELATVSFLNHGIRVYLFSDICPTPFLSFAVNINKCMAGIMITASHNRKTDNGYKVYWENGVPIIPPHDMNINAHILKHLEPCEKAWDTTIIKHHTLLRDPLVQVSGMYFKLLRRSVLQPETNKASNLKITYTAMHGVSHRFMVEAFKAGSFNPLIAVKEQKDPNPDFPTLEFPNPEEKFSLSLAMRTADEMESTLLLATDPDGDRLVVAEKYELYGGDDDDDDEEAVWRVFTGNELGGLLAWWALHNHRQRNPSAELADVHIVGTVVTTKLIGSMAQAEGFIYEEAPAVGFTWLANRVRELTLEGKTVLFGCDEPASFVMTGVTGILDKDGIASGMSVAGLAAHLDAANMTLSDKLQELYATYGHHIGYNSCLVTSIDGGGVAHVFHRLRHFAGDDDDETTHSYPETLDGGRYRVVRVRDFATGYDSARPEREVDVDGPATAQNDTIEFVFNNEVSLVVRAGTDRINYYTDVCVAPGEEEVWAFRDTLDEMVEAIIVELFQPEKNGLVRRPA